MSNTFELGPIRPTSEGASLLIRVTRGCAWNQCKFCNNYRTIPFSTRPLEEIQREIDTMARYRDMIRKHFTPGGADLDAINAEYALLPDEEKHCYYHLYNWIARGEYTVFLQDGDAMCLSEERLMPILRYIRQVLPETTRITSYARPDSLARKSVEELKEIRGYGLDRVHAGFESGSDKVLQLITKGCTSQQQIDGGRKTMEAGIELSLFLMAGLGGRKLSDENADETARVVNAINPSFVRLRSTTVIDGTPLSMMQKAGVFDELTEIEQVKEMRRFLSNLEGCTGEVYTDHIVNLLGSLEGSLTDIPALLSYVDEFLALPREEQRRYQMARRMGFGGDWTQMHYIPESDMKKVDQMCASVPDGPKWEKLMKDNMRRYI